MVDNKLKDNELEDDGKSIYVGVLASIVNDRLFNEYKSLSNIDYIFLSKKRIIVNYK